MTVRCPSNGRSASSTSGLRAPAAQSSAGRAACSCLPWPAVMPRRPHRPLLLPPLARPSLQLSTPPVLLHRLPNHSALEPVNPRTPLLCDSTPASSHLRLVVIRGLTVMMRSVRRGQCGQRPTSIGRVLCVERLTAGSTTAARKCLLITRKIIIPPPDSRDPPNGPSYFVKKTFPLDCWDPPATSSHARKCVQKKRFAPLTAGTHHLHLCTQGSA